MADMLVELIEKFIGGSEATLNSLFKSMTTLVFFIERELGGIKVANGGYINFNSIYETIFNYAIFVLVIVFITKAIKIYFMMREGDSLVLLIVWLILICQLIMKQNRDASNEIRNSICIYWTSKF